jgi:DNA-binding response OmpR family regulator
MDILLIDDEVSLRRTLRTTLESMAHTAAEASSGEQALRLLQKQRFDAAFLDLRLGREAGLDLLPSLLREAPDLAVVVVTAYATIASAVEAMRRGAFDYLPKPICSTTRLNTRRTAAGSRCRRRRSAKIVCAFPWPTPAWASRRSFCPTCSRNSSVCRGTREGAARVWDWPSSVRSSSPTTAKSRSRVSRAVGPFSL